MAKKKAKKPVFEFKPQQYPELVQIDGPGDMMAMSAAEWLEDPNEVGFMISDANCAILVGTLQQARWIRDLCQAAIDAEALPEE